jgi:hypothetical protein
MVKGNFTPLALASKVNVVTDSKLSESEKPSEELVARVLALEDLGDVAELFRFPLGLL